MQSIYFEIFDKIAKNLTFEPISEDDFQTLFEDEYADIIPMLQAQGYLDVSGDVGKHCCLYVTDKAIVEYRQEQLNRKLQAEERCRSNLSIIIASIGVFVGILSLILGII